MPTNGRFSHIPVVLRFWSKVRKADGDACWLWTAGRHAQGYGQFSVNARTVRAHRVAWELAFGQIPDSLCVLHECDNPPCVRPDHLFLGTLKDNTADMMAKGRQNWPGNPLIPYCKNGHPRTPENMYFKRGVSSGTCKVCHNAYQKKWKEARKAGQLYRRGWSEVGL